MKKFLYKLLLFFSIIFLIALVINFTVGKYNNTPQHFSLQYDEVINRKVKANCIIIGTSHATHSIRPSYLNTDRYRFYNLALNGAGPGFYLNWYKYIFNPNYPDPKYFIVAVDWFMFDDDWLWRRYEQDAIYFPSKTFYKNLLQIKSFNTRSLIQNRFPFFIHRNISDLKFAIDRKHGDDAFWIKEYDDGFLPWSAKNKKGLFIPPKNIVTDRAIERNFISLINLFQSKGARIIFINIPEYDISIEEYKTKATLKFIYSFAKQRNIPFLNYNIEKRSVINLDATNFIDWGHMSPEGSKKFSKMLGEDLKKIMN